MEIRKTIKKADEMGIVAFCRQLEDAGNHQASWIAGTTAVAWCRRRYPPKRFR